MSEALAPTTCYTVQSTDKEAIVIQRNGVTENITHGNVIAILDKGSGFDHDGQTYCMLALSTDESKEKNASSPLSLRALPFSSLPPNLLSTYSLSSLPPHLSLCHANPLSSSPPRDLTILISTKSGTGQSPSFFTSILQPLLSLLGLAPESYTLHSTSSERWISEFAASTLCARANAGIPQTIILLSGDGGVSDIVNGLFSQPQSERYVKPTVALLVLGTGNALANSSGLNLGAAKGLPALLRGRARRVPTLVCRCAPGSVLLVDEGRGTEELPVDDSGRGIVHGAVVASWCLHASLVADSDTAAYRKHGAARFSMAANELLAPADGSASHVYRGRITTWQRDGEGKMARKVWEREGHMYVLATLVSNLEAAMKVSPESRPLDGQLRLVGFKALPSEKVKEIFGMAFDGGRHVEHPEVDYEQIEGLRIDLLESDPRWRRVCVDGKIVRVPENGWVEIWREEKDVVDLVVDHQI